MKPRHFISVSLLALTLLASQSIAGERQRESDTDKRAIAKSSAAAKSNTLETDKGIKNQQTGVTVEKAETQSAQDISPVQVGSVVQPVAEALPNAGEQIKWQVISAGGTKGTSTSYALNGTIGQAAVGIGSSTNYKIIQGFWQSFSCCLKAGDANNDTKVNVGDAVFMINYVFKAGTPPVCKDQADANHDCKLNVGDAVFLINYVFKSGTPPQCGCVGS